MSVINNIKNELANANTISIAKSRADSLKTTTVNIYDAMTAAFNEGAYNFWATQDCSPQDIANELGTNASGIFYLHARLGELIALVDPSTIAPGLSVVGTYTNNPDGSIIVTSVPSGV